MHVLAYRQTNPSGLGVHHAGCPLDQAFKQCLGRFLGTGEKLDRLQLAAGEPLLQILAITADELGTLDAVRLKFEADRLALLADIDGEIAQALQL